MDQRGGVELERLGLTRVVQGQKKVFGEVRGGWVVGSRADAAAGGGVPIKVHLKVVRFTRHQRFFKALVTSTPLFNKGQNLERAESWLMILEYVVRNSRSTPTMKIHTNKDTHTACVAATLFFFLVCLRSWVLRLAAAGRVPE